MAIINFTPADAMQTIVVETDYYPTQIIKLEGPTKSSSGKSFNYFADFAITDGKYKGKERTIIFNTESNEPFNPGGMQMLPQSYLLQIDAAINNKKIEAVNFALELDTLVMKPFDAQWVATISEGNAVNQIVSFHPTGYAATAPAF